MMAFNKKRKFRFYYPKLLSVIFFVLLFTAYAYTLASPPGSPYQSGFTLDPTCAPGSLNCFVQIIPDQTGNSGKFLTTDGTVTSWATVSGGSPALSSLSAAIATNTINNANFAQEWQWNSLSSNSGLKLSSSSTAAASNTQKLFELSLSGVNATSSQTTYASYISNAHTGTSATNYAGYFTATGTSNTRNIGLYATATGATNNYAAIFEAGEVLVGSATDNGTYILQVTGDINHNGDMVFPNAGGVYEIKADLTVSPEGQNITLSAGDGSSGFGATGGDVTLTAGNGTGAGTVLGGDIYLNPGTGNTANGYVYIDPTSIGEVLISTSTDAGAFKLQVNGNSYLSGSISAATAITASGAITFSGLSTTGIVHNSSAGVLSTSLIALGDLLTQGTATDEFCLTSETGGGALLAWQACGGALSDTDYGDIVVSGSGTVMTIDTDVIDFADIADSLSLDAATDINLGANAFTIDMDSTGDFSIRDGVTDIALFTDSGAITFAPTSGQSLTNTLAGAGTFTINSEVTTGSTTTSAFAGNFNALTTGTGMYLASSTLSSGSLINLDVTGTAATSNTQKALNISTSGANGTSAQTTYGAYISNTHTGTTSTNIGLYATASGGTNNYAAIFEAGSVGIGDITPDYLLDVANTGIDGDIFSLTDSDGECLHNPEAGSETVSCSSDERLKQNIVDAGSALAYFKPFKIREYDVIASGNHLTGVIAQEVLQTNPELVSMGSNGMYSVQLPNQWQTIKAIQELDTKITPFPEFKTLTETTLADMILGGEQTQTLLQNLNMNVDSAILNISLLETRVSGLDVSMASLTLSQEALSARVEMLKALIESNSFNSLASVTTETLTVQINGTFNGQSQFNGLSFFGNVATFTNGALFDSQAEFSLPPLFNKDTAGFALIKQGDKRVRIVFDQAYLATPVVNTSLTFESTDNIGDSEVLSFFDQDVRSVVLDKDQAGFTILLNKPAARDLRFSWLALAVRDPKVFESVIEGLIIETLPIEPTPEPILEPEPVTLPEPTPASDSASTPLPDPVLTPQEPVLTPEPEPIPAQDLISIVV